MGEQNAKILMILHLSHALCMEDKTQSLRQIVFSKIRIPKRASMDTTLEQCIPWFQL